MDRAGESERTRRGAGWRSRPPGRASVVTRSMRSAALAAACVLAAGAGAQELNKRDDAPPGSKATISRLMPKALTLSAEQDKDLVRDVIATDCQPVRIGNVDEKGEQGLRPRENVVVVRGNVVNLCR